MSDHMGEPTQEEIEAYYAQLREAPVGDLLMQCIGMLAAGAEAKLGRMDARTLIDGMGALVQIGAPHLGEATDQLEAAVAQLQMGQVHVERQIAEQQGGAAPVAPAADAAQPPTAPAAPPQPGQAPAPQPSQPAQPSAADKLWIPGR